MIKGKSRKYDHRLTCPYGLLFDHAGIPILIDAARAIVHNKIMIVDGETVITGSSNFTKAAEEKNAENLLITHNKTLAERYILMVAFNAKTAALQWH